MNLKKKIVLSVSFIVLVAVCVIALIRDEQSGMKYRCMNTAKYEEILNRLPQMQELSFSLCFREQKLPVNESDHTFFLPVDLSSGKWEMGEFTATDDVDIFFLEDFKKEEKKKLVAENVSIPMIAVSGEGYLLCYLKLTGMPVLSFQGTEWYAQDGNPIFDMVLYENCGMDDWITHVYTTATIRGNTSKEYEKKSLRLKLKKEKKDGSFGSVNKNLLGIRSDDDWILNSLYADNSRIRDKLCMELWQECGAWQNPYQANFGVQGEYTEVVINNGYAGLYLLTHPIDAKQLRMQRTSRQIAAGEDIIERIYKKKYTAAWQTSDFTGDFPDPNLKDFRGGFFLKGDVVTGELSEWQPLYEMAACIEADDQTFTELIGQIADTKNIADNWLFFQAIGGFDNENKNVYYIARNQNNRYYGYFIPWDMNLSFGSVYTDNVYYSEESMAAVKQLVMFEPGTRMIDLDVMQSRKYVKNTWEKWRNGAFATDKLISRMEELQEQIIASGALAREMQRWPDGNANEDISFMKEYTKQRMEFVDGYLSGI